MSKTQRDSSVELSLITYLSSMRNPLLRLADTLPTHQYNMIGVKSQVFLFVLYML